MATISIIVPMYNVAPYLPKCCESIIAHAHPDTQVILVDDGSTDGSLEIAQNLLQAFNPIAISQANTGPGSARNAGILAATSEYILFLDGDDFLLNIPNISGDVTFGRYIKYLNGNPLPHKQHTFTASDTTSIAEYVIAKFPEPSWNSAWRYIVKREFLLRHQLFFHPTMHCEDLKWVLELLHTCDQVGANFHFADGPFYAYNYRRKDSIMNSLNPKRTIDLNTIIKQANQTYRDNQAIRKELRFQMLFYINEYWLFSDRRALRASYKGLYPRFLLYPSSLALYGVRRLHHFVKKHS